MKTTFKLFLSCLLCLALPLLSGCGNNAGANAHAEQPWQMPTLPPSAAPGVEPLMTRGHLALEESDWSAATGFFDRALDLDAQYAPAYVGKLLAELRMRSEEQLDNHSTPISDLRNFELAIRFADVGYRAKLQGYNQRILDRIRQEAAEAEAQAVAERAERERIQQEFEARFAHRVPGSTARIAAEREGREGKAGGLMVLTINGVEYFFRWCPPGTFTMGSPEGEEGRSGFYERQHQVTLSRGFWMLETQVTQAMWISVMGYPPSHFQGANLPVETVSWSGAQAYIRQLNDLGVAPAGYRFSLPTEAQWEYACRAGTTTAFHFGDTLTREQANFGRNVGRTTDVGSYPANAWGLYDMHGNVWEWVQDRYGAYPSGAVTDPTGAERGSLRVLRGGSWDRNAEYCRSASRILSDPSFGNYNLGLRLSLVSQ